MRSFLGAMAMAAAVFAHFAACDMVSDLTGNVAHGSMKKAGSLGFVGTSLAQRFHLGSRDSCTTTACSLWPKLHRLRYTPLAMSEMPWEPNAKPENNVGYSNIKRGLAYEAKEGAKFLGDLPSQRVFVTAMIDCPRTNGTWHYKPSFRTPTNDAVDEVQESLNVRAALHRMMHQEVIDAYTGKQPEQSGDETHMQGATLHLKFGNANGFFRRWPQQQYDITLSQVGNNEFDVSPECSAEALSEMGIVSIRAQYISGERMLKLSGFMDGCDIDGELRAVPMIRSGQNQRVY